MAALRGPFIFSLVLMGTLAGCLNVPDEAPGDDGRDEGVADQERLLRTLRLLPQLDFDPAPAVDWWASFVSTYAKRDHGFPNNVPAAQAIADEMGAAGYEVRILEYEWAGDPEPVRVVEAVRLGVTNPDHRIALISHYDTHSGTTQGAYDDGSGVAVEVSICKLLAQVETNKTIACLFFDAEELGLVGSSLYVEDVITQGDEPFVYDQGFGYDMVGLNWPGYTPWKLYVMAGLDHEGLGEYMDFHLAFLNVTTYGFLGERYGVTSEGVEILDVHDRNSDEQNFKRAGVPVVRFAGGRHASDYPQYHRPLDVAEYVYLFAAQGDPTGPGRQNFEKGYEMVVLASYYTILAYDAYDPKALPLL